MKKYLALISLVLVSLGIYGQRLISGTVIYEDTNELIVGAVIFVKHTGIGTITDLEGHFSLAVPDSSYITITCMGYRERTLSVQDLDSDTITVVLKEQIRISTTDF